jgi:hypothetical protein
MYLVLESKQICDATAVLFSLLEIVASAHAERVL